MSIWPSTCGPDPFQPGNSRPAMEWKRELGRINGMFCVYHNLYLVWNGQRQVVAWVREACHYERRSAYLTHLKLFGPWVTRTIGGEYWDDLEEAKASCEQSLGVAAASLVRLVDEGADQ